MGTSLRQDQLRILGQARGWGAGGQPVSILSPETSTSGKNQEALCHTCLPAGYLHSREKEPRMRQRSKASNIWEGWRVWVPSGPQEEKRPVSCVLVLANPHHTPGSAGSHIQLQRASPGPWLSVPSLKRRDVMVTPGMCPGPPPSWCQFPTCQTRNFQLRPGVRKGCRSHQLWEPMFWPREQKGAEPSQCRAEGGKPGSRETGAQKEASNKAQGRPCPGGESRASCPERAGSCPSFDLVPHQAFPTPRSPPPSPTTQAQSSLPLVRLFNKREPLSIVPKINCDK